MLIQARSGTGHPTIKTPEQGLEVLRRFRSQYRAPQTHEGYTRILHLRPSDLPPPEPEYTEADVRNVMVRLADSQEVIPSVPPAFRDGPRGGVQGNRGYYSSRGYQPRGRAFYRGGSPSRGGYRDGAPYQPTPQWNRQPLGGTTSQSQGSSWRSGWQEENRERPREDRTQESWRR